MKGKSRS